MVNWQPSMHKGLDIVISDEASSTVIHVKGPVNARMCDVGCVFDKLGVDLISCSTAPASRSCDMTLVVVDRCDSQPLRDGLKQSVAEGLQRVFSAHSQQASPDSRGSSSAAAGAAARHSYDAGVASAVQHEVPSADAEQQQAAGSHAGLQSSSRTTSVEACRADSASESITFAKVSSGQLSLSVEVAAEQQRSQQPHQAWCEVAGTSLSSLPVSLMDLPTSGQQQRAPVSSRPTTADDQQHVQQPAVRFSEDCSSGTAPLQRTASGRPPKPALKIDIPSDSDSSSRWQNDSNNVSNSTSANPSSRWPVQADSPLAGVICGARDRARPQQQQQQQGGVQVQDLTRRLMELGMVRTTDEATGSSSSSSDEGDDDDGDAAPSFGGRSGGSGSSAAAGGRAATNWQGPLNSRSCGDLLMLAGRQQRQRMHRSSDVAAVESAEGPDVYLDCFPEASRNSIDMGSLAGQGDRLVGHGDSSHSLGSGGDPSVGRRGAVPLSPAAALAGSGGSGGCRRPPPRIPSRIILSPVGPDGTGEVFGQPRLFVSIPKSGDEQRKLRRSGSSCSQSVAATPRVPFTPAANLHLLTPASAGVRGGQVLKQISSSLVGRKQLSPTAAAAAEATANMPLAVAVAGAQYLSSSSSNTRHAAAAVVAAAAEKSDSSTPLPSPLHVPNSELRAARRFSVDSLLPPVSPRVPRTSPCGFHHPPPTPVHPAVAAAAALVISAAAEAATQSQAVPGLLQQLQAAVDDSRHEDDDEVMQLPACLSPQRSNVGAFFAATSPVEVPAPSSSPEAATAAAAAIGEPPATILEGSEEEGRSSSGAVSTCSEEWWCGELTGLTVRDIMTGPVKAVSADADMLQARQLMMQHNLPGMLVDAGPGQQPGFLTRGDFFKAPMLRRKGSRKRPHKPCVRDIMSPVLVVDAGMSIEGCAQAMQEAGVRHAAVRDASAAADAAAAAEGGSSQHGSDGSSSGGQAAGSMAEYVGLVSNAAIFRCLGLYPDDALAGEEELLEEGLLGLPRALRLHSGLDSSFDSSGGTDTPLSSRSRVATPHLERGGRDSSAHQEERQQSASTDVGAPSGQQSRQTSLVKLPDLVMLREGFAAQGSSASSMCSVRSGVTAAADSRKGGAVSGVSDDGNVTRSGSFALAGAPSDGSGLGVLAEAAADASILGSTLPADVPDALARYKSAAALWEVDMDDIEMIKRIGEGSFGEVMLATYRGTKVAVKRLRVLDLDKVGAPNEQYGAGGSSDSAQSSGDVDGSQRAMGASQAAFRQFFEREIAILASIRHPNVVNFIGACHKPGQRCLVTEYCARGSLDQVLHKSGLTLDLTKRIEFALDIARGMACLHAQRPIIIHRDLKTANLLVSARFEVKVADFGLSRIKDASHLQVSRAGLEGTIEYCAPEVLRGEPYTERCDVYSFGVVLWELLLRQRPYSDAEVPVFLLMVNIGNGTLMLPEVPVESATPGLVELVNHCLAFSAADRPEFREVLATLEGEYRALRARQPPRQPPSTQKQQQQQQPVMPQHQQIQAAVLRCDSASSLAVNQQSPRLTADSPDPGSTPYAQSPAGTFGPSANVQPALVSAGTGAGSFPGLRAGEQDAYGLQQQVWPPMQPQQQPQQRHRLSQHDSGMQPAGSAGPAFAEPSTPTFEFGVQQSLQPAGTPQLQGPQVQAQQYTQLQYGQQFGQQYTQQYHQQQVFSVPLPQVQLQQQQQVFVASACSSPRQQQPQHFAVPVQAHQQPGQYVVPQLRVMSALSGNLGPQQQHGQCFVPSNAGTPVPPAAADVGTASKPPRHKQQLSRARSMPVPESVSWELEGQGEEQGGGGGTHGCQDPQEDTGGHQDVLLFAEDSFGGVSNCSMTGYSPCPSGQLCMLVEPTSSTFGSSSAAGMMPYQQPQQQVLLTQDGQQVALQQVPMQPVLIQQPGGQLQQAYIQQQPTYTTLTQLPPQQQQQPQQAQRILQRTLGTPSPTPAVLARSGPPLSSSPSPAVNYLAVLAAAGSAAAAARREGSASGAGSPRGPSHAGSSGIGGTAAAAAAAGHHSRSSSHGCSQEMPPLQFLQLGDMYISSRPSSPQRSVVTPVRSERLSSEGGGGGGGFGGTLSPQLFPGGGAAYQHYPQQQQQQQPQVVMAPATVMVNAAGPAMVTPLLLQRLDSLHRSGSSGCSPRCPHRSSSPGLQSADSGQVLGLLVPGYCPGATSGPSSPRSHSPRAPAGHSSTHAHPQPAGVAAAHHLHRPGSSRLAIQGSYELPPGTAAAAAAGEAAPVGAAASAHTQPAAAGGGAIAGGGFVAGVAGPGGPGLVGQYNEAPQGAQVLPVYGVSVVHAQPAHMYHHQFPQPHPAVLQAGGRRAPSLLRIDSNSRDRAVSPFATAQGTGPFGEQQGSSHGGVAAAPAGTFSRTLPPFAAASSGSSLDDVASRGDRADVVQQPSGTGNNSYMAAAGVGAGAGVAATAGGTAVSQAGLSSSRQAAPARYVSPFAAAAASKQSSGDGEDTGAVFDTGGDCSSRPSSPDPASASKQGVQGGSKGPAAGSLSARGDAGVSAGAAPGATAAAGGASMGVNVVRLASPFALMQEGRAAEQ